MNSRSYTVTKYTSLVCNTHPSPHILIEIRNFYVSIQMLNYFIAAVNYIVLINKYSFVSVINKYLLKRSRFSENFALALELEE